MTSLAAWLKANEEKWNQSAKQSKEAGEFSRHPDGKYLVKLTKADLGLSKSNDRPQIAWGYTIMDGDLEGEVLYDWDGLDSSEESMVFVARKISKYGYDPEEIKLRNLPRILDEILEKQPYIQVRAKTRGDYQNIHVDKVYPEDWSPDSDDDDDDDDLPPARTPAKPAAAKPAAKSTPAATSATRTPAKPAPKAADDDGDDDGDDEDDDTPPSKPAAKTPARPAAAKPAAKAATPPPAKPKTPAKPAPAPEPEPEETDTDDEDGEELEIGMMVEFERNDKTMVGEVTEIDEDSGTVQVKVGKKTYPVDIDDLTIAEDEDEEDEE